MTSSSFPQVRVSLQKGACQVVRDKNKWSAIVQLVLATSGETGDERAARAPARYERPEGRKKHAAIMTPRGAKGKGLWLEGEVRARSS